MLGQLTGEQVLASQRHCPESCISCSALGTKHRAGLRHCVTAPFVAAVKSTQKSVPSVLALYPGTKHAETVI